MPFGSSNVLQDPVHSKCSRRPHKHRWICLSYLVCALSHSVVSSSLPPHGLQSARLLCLQNSPDKNTKMGCHFLLQGNFLTQGSNPYLLHWQVDSLPLSPQGSPYSYLISHQSLPFNNFGSLRQFSRFKGFCSSEEGAVDNREGEPDLQPGTQGVLERFLGNTGVCCILIPKRRLVPRLWEQLHNNVSV